MIRDDETMRLVANVLQEQERRLVRIQKNGRVGRFRVNFFHPLRQPDDRRGDAARANNRKRRVKLPQSAVQDDEIRLCPIVFTAVAPRHDLCHRFEIVRRTLRRLQFEFAVLALRRSPAFKNDHGRDRLRALVMGNIETFHPLG